MLSSAITDIQHGLKAVVAAVFLCSLPRNGMFVAAVLREGVTLPGFFCIVLSSVHFNHLTSPSTFNDLLNFESKDCFEMLP